MNRSIFLGLILLVVSCQNKQEKQKLISEKSLIITLDSLPQYDSSPIVFKDSTIVWSSLQEFHSRLEGFKHIRSVEDIKLLTEELLELHSRIEESEKPELFNTEAVASRLILIKTYLLQLQSYIELNQDLNSSTLQIHAAHQSLLNKLALLEKSAEAPQLTSDDLD